MNEHIAFFTPVFTTELQLPYDDIVRHIKHTQNNSLSCTLSNIGGWQSPYFNVLDNLQPPMTQVYDAVINNAFLVFRKYNISRFPRLVNYWYNINKKYNYNAPHAHQRTTVSAVLYVKTPSNCGELVIHNPAPPFSGHPDAPNEYNTALYKVTPSVGKLVMFSSDLIHSVSQNLTDDNDDERISIAFDFD